MNKHREYLKTRFPALAAEFDKIPDELFWDDVSFSADDEDYFTDSTTIASAFTWSKTPQGYDFWMAVWVSREENEGA